MCLQALVEIRGSNPRMSVPHAASTALYTTRPLWLGTNNRKLTSCNCKAKTTKSWWCWHSCVVGEFVRNSIESNDVPKSCSPKHLCWFYLDIFEYLSSTSWCRQIDDSSLNPKIFFKLFLIHLLSPCLQLVEELWFNHVHILRIPS